MLFQITAKNISQISHLLIQDRQCSINHTEILKYNKPNVNLDYIRSLNLKSNNFQLNMITKLNLNVLVIVCPKEYWLRVD
jgi:hypothetical protein